MRKTFAMMAATCGFLVAAPLAQAEIDGHGPDAWRVAGVAANDVLNMRMGPGTQYLVIDQLAPNARGLQLVTCVPLLIQPYYTALTEAQRNDLPQRWCLMRSADLTKAGWVAQRFITPEGESSAASSPAPVTTTSSNTGSPDVMDDLVAQARDLVREVYERQFHADNGGMTGPLDPAVAGNYFTSDIVNYIAAGRLEAHPLYNAQDFDVVVSEPQPDPDQPMFRGMITINVDFVNFGHPQRAVFRLRADTERPGAPLRIFRIEHDGWSFPE